MTPIERAAEARSREVRALADRPRQRRFTEEPGGWAAGRTITRARIVTRDATAGDGALDFEGYASVYEAPYEMYDFFGAYNEVVSRGAAARSLGTENLDVPLVLGHDSMRRIARTTNGSLLLSEDETGLLTRAPNLDPTDPDVAYIAPKLRSGLIDEMSFRFVITSGTWSPDYTEFRIDTFDIHRGDVSIVGYGANPATVGALREDAAPAVTRSVDLGAFDRVLATRPPILG